MHSKPIACFLMLVAMTQLATVGHTQDLDSLLPENIQRHMRYLTGTWNYTYEQDGQEYSGVWSAAPAESGAGLVSHFREVGPEGEVAGNYVHGWNKNTNQLVDHFVSGKLGIGSATYNLISQKRAEGVGESTLPDGTKRTTKLRSEYMPNEIVWTHFETVKGGESQEEAVFTFKRRKTPVGIEKMKAFESRIGTWVTTGDDGKTETMTYRRINNDSFVEMVAGDFRVIIGWDLKEESIVGWGFGTHGGQGKTIYQHEGNRLRGKTAWLNRWGTDVVATIESEVDGDTLTTRMNYDERASETVWRRVQ